MSRPFYENFDIVFLPSQTESGTYQVSVLGTPAGDIDAGTFSLQGAPEELLNTITRNFQIDKPTEPPDITKPVSLDSKPEIGQYLFNKLFQTKLETALQVSLDRARSRNAFLRLRLNLTKTPELVGIPWEMLRSESDSLALSTQTSVVRYQNIAFPTEKVAVSEKPVRMLVVVSAPTGPEIAHLEVEKEYNKIAEALKPFSDQKLIELERLQTATIGALDERLLDPNKPPIHILHYIGHGVFDKDQKKGELLFELESGATNPDGSTYQLIDGERLGQTLRSHESLRLATLNACEGAMVSTDDSYAGVAQYLLRTGNVPVVIAMRRAISDPVAIAFAKTFYKWLLTNNLSVDGAMTRARLGMRDEEQRLNGNKTLTEWATPIIFMRDYDGYLVNFEDVPQIIVPPVLPDVDPQLTQQYKTVLNALTKGKLVPFLGLDVNLFGRAIQPNWDPANGILPSYTELVNYLVSITKHPIPYVPALADVSQYALLQYKNDENKGENTFYSDLIDIFTKPGQPTPLHLFWARLAKNNDQLTGTDKDSQDVSRRFVVVSNTYDNLLEKAFSQTLDRFHVVSYVAHGDYKGRFRHTIYAKSGPGSETTAQDPIIIESANNYGALYDQVPAILKIPGSVGDGAGPRFAITEDQYLEFFSKRELTNVLPTQLLTKLRNSNHLFLGYNVREWHLRALLYRIWEDHKAPVAAWAIHSQPTEVEKEYWKACGVRLIQCPLADYIDGLRKSCETLLPGVQL
jgi:CHAT domain/SIR2-like domain